MPPEMNKVISYIKYYVAELFSVTKDYGAIKKKGKLYFWASDSKLLFDFQLYLLCTLVSRLQSSLSIPLSIVLEALLIDFANEDISEEPWFNLGCKSFIC